MELSRLRCVLLGCLLAAVACQPVPATAISDDDKAAVIRLTLERALLAREVPDYHLIKDKANIVLSTQNLDPAWVPRLDSVSLVLRNPEDIQAKADRDGGYLYLRFRPLEFHEDGRITVSLDNDWAVSKDFRGLYMSGGGFSIDYRRKGRTWVGKVTQSWIS